jgi:hypothetical protein
MPWCDECAKYWAPSAMTAEGNCPRCGRQIESPERAEAADGTDEDVRAPWHFKLMVVALVAYLVYRFYAMFS